VTFTRSYDALVLDVDGTLLDLHDRVHPRTQAALSAARAAGVVVMLATGRSSGGVREIARRYTPGMPAIVFNGAALYSPDEDRVLERSMLPTALAARVLAFARDRPLLPVVATPDGQYTRAPLTEGEARVLADFRQLHVQDPPLPLEQVIRITLLSEHHPDSQALHAEIEGVLQEPAYVTHFPLEALPQFKGSSIQVVDVQPDCGGKAEALRVLSQRYGVEPSRVVAVGDADNDLPMLAAAGLGVAMGNGTDNAKQVARRIIGHNDSDALGALIEELFLPPSAT
jgi:Cof subfamily protein (haloacid dehalogenase superfamily)